MSLFACEEERPQTVSKTEKVKVVKKEKYTQLDDILFIDNEFRPNQDLYFELLNEFKGNNFEMRRINYISDNKMVIMDFVMHESGNLTRKCKTEMKNDTLFIDYRLTYPEECPSVEYFSKYQIRLPLNKYKFKYLAFPKSKIVKSLKEIEFN